MKSQERWFRNKDHTMARAINGVIISDTTIDPEIIGELEWCHPGYSPAQYQKAIDDAIKISKEY